MTEPESVSTARPKTRPRDWFRMAILLLVTGIVFWFLFRDVPFASVAGLMRRSRLVPLCLGIGLTATFPILSAWRWKAIMDGLGTPLRFGRAFTLIMACWPLSTFTPSKGSDLAKGYFLRGEINVGLVLGSVLAERLLDVLTLLAFCLFGALWFGWVRLAQISGLLLGLGVLAVIALMILPLPVPAKIRPKVDRLLSALRLLLRRPALLAMTLLLTSANWLASVLQTWLFFQALGDAVSFGLLLAALPAAIFVGLLPMTLMGMGTRDAALLRLLVGHAASPAILGVGLLYSLCGYWLPGLIGLPFLRSALRKMDS